MSVYIITISEMTPCHGNSVSVKAFSSEGKAINWIEGQITATVTERNLNRSQAVDGWFVEIDRDHTIQYDICIEEVL